MEIRVGGPILQRRAKTTMALALSMTKHAVPSFEEIQQLFKELMGRLPPGAASRAVHPQLGNSPGFHFELTPNTTTSARIAARITKKGVVLFFGEAAIFEVPSRGRRYTDLDCLSEIRKLCIGVIDGNFEETVTRSGTLVIGGKGRISFDDTVALEGWQTAFVNPFRGRERILKKYQPYPTAN